MKIFDALRHMEDIRASHDVFSCNANVYTIETGCASVLGIVREYAGHELRAFSTSATWISSSGLCLMIRLTYIPISYQARHSASLEQSCLDMDAGGSTDSYSESFYRT